MNGLLADRVAVVSGVGPGLGRALALACAREGAHVVLAARSEDTLDDVAGEIEAAGRQALVVPTDVTDEADCDALATAAVKRFERVDVLVNNAFVQPPLEAIADAGLDTWRHALEVNLLGAVSVTNAVAARMRERGAGSVIFVASMSARRVQRRFGVYSATKAALLTAAQHYANELGHDGVRVNSIVPGYVYGPNVQWWFAHRASKRGVEPQEIYDEVAAETALRHLPTAEEVADCAVLLACDLSRAVTGAALDVNAGHSFH